MKINTQRVAKCIASFMGIALALILCVTPAFASEDGIYDPADYEVGSPQVDSSTGKITYTYEFGVTPRINSYYDDVYNSSDVTADTIVLRPPIDTKKVSYRTYPLGVYGNPYGQWPADRGVVDVRDFKAYSQFTLSATFDVSLAFIMMQSGVFEMRSFWDVICYDASGQNIGLIRSDTTSLKYTIEDSWSSGTTYTAGGVIQLPEGTAYILPTCMNSIYVPSLVSESRFEIRAHDLKLEFSIDSVLENTLTMQVIKNQLSDISEGIQDTNDKLDDTNDKLDDANNKLDDIISGSPEDMQDAEQSASDLQQEIDSFESIMEDLEQYEKIDQVWSADVLTYFINGKGYLWVKDLISPLLNWSPYSTIMLTILALVNLSLILFGR